MELVRLQAEVKVDEEEMSGSVGIFDGPNGVVNVRKIMDIV